MKSLGLAPPDTLHALTAFFCLPLSRLCGTFGEDRTAFLDSLGDYDLLIIDDLGVERNTELVLLSR